MTRLFDLLYHQAKEQPLEASISGRDSNGKWKSYSSQEVLDLSEKAACGLLKMGLRPGDKVGMVIYKNRPEWMVMDFAIQMAGMVSIPLYPTISASEYEYILNEAEAKAVFCGGSDLSAKLSKVKKNIPSLTHLYTFDKGGDHPFWEDILTPDGMDQVEKIKNSLKGEDLATIIYTSGTTGNPKGVMLTHANIMHIVLKTGVHLQANYGEKVLSFLPLCHIFERAVSFTYYSKGASIYFCGTDTLSGPEGDLASVKPFTFTTVPRLLEKIYEAIYNKGLGLKGVKKKLFFWALRLAMTYDLHQRPSSIEKLKWNLADKLIFSKWRAALGGNVRAIVTGAAPCPITVMRVFCAAGIPVREGYGLTETSPTITVNTMEPDGAMLGAVGPAIEGVEIFIDNRAGIYADGEGEILVKGPNVMSGYYKKPQINAVVFQEIEGKTWFCTGDIGKVVKGPTGREFLKITDRKKELLKTSGGKYVAPAPIENRLRESFLVEQIMLVGDNRKFVSALIVPAEEPLKNWCHHKKLQWTNLKEMVLHEKVIKKYQKVVNKYNPEFNHVEQIKKFRLIPHLWLPLHEDQSEAELTPTLKLKRRVILKKFASDIQEIYSS